MGRIIVVGASGHAKVVVEAIEKQREHTVIGLLDDARPPGEAHFGYRVLGRVASLPDHAHEVDAFFVAIGDGFVRERIARELRAVCPALEFATVVHPSAVIARGVALGEGTVVMAGAVLQPDVRVGEGCIVNTRASIDHDCTVGDYAAVSPGATLGGNVHVGSQAFIGIGASILHGRTVGEHAVLGAGSVVTEDVPANAVAFGVPARVVRQRAPGERYL